MWRYKLRELLSRPPEFLTISDSRQNAFSGKYLHIEREPYALGRLIGEGDEAQVFELVSLRHGYFDKVIKICKHRRESSAYRTWAHSVRDEVNPHSYLPEVEKAPATLIELPCGGIVKIQPYMTAHPDTDWRSTYPALPVLEKLHRGKWSEAEKLCDQLLQIHGLKAVLLEQWALLSVCRDELEEGRRRFEEAVAAHRKEENSAVLGALYNLALTLLSLHETESRPGLVEIDLGNGLIHRQQIIPIDATNLREPTDLSDVALEVLVEALSFEPFFSSALALMCNIIQGGGESESFEILASSLLKIDPYYPETLWIRERLYQLQNAKESLEEPDVSQEIPPHIQAMLVKRASQYEPPVPDGAQDAESLYLAALQYAQRDDYVRAERDLERACVLDPRNAMYVVELSDLYCRQGQWEQAKDYLRGSVHRFSDDWRIYEVLGRVYSELNEPRDACVAFHKALACNPPVPWIIKARLGMSYCKLDRLDVAMQHIREAYENDSGNWLINLYLLQCLKRRILKLYEDQQVAQAAQVLAETDEILRAGERRGIMNADLFFVKGQFLMLQLRPEEALSALGEALRLEPGHLHARGAYDAVKAHLEGRA